MRRSQLYYLRQRKMDKHTINISVQGFPKEGIGKLLYSYLMEIAKVYSLREQYAYEYFIENPTGRQVFCEWVESKGYLSLKSFHFVLQSGKTIGSGFEILKDERLTMALLAAGLTNDDN